MLEVKDISTGYGKKQVLYDVSLTLGPGEIMALIGPNGAGKSTILKALFGLLPLWSGSISFRGTPLDGLSSMKRRHRGLCLVPQGRRVFPDLSVKDNLRIGGWGLDYSVLERRIAEVTEPFPILRERHALPARLLSGGEQQMLAIARAMIERPALLMLDEPSLGLAPNLVADVLAHVHRIGQETNTAVLIVEQKVKQVLQIATRVVALKLGKTVHSGEAGVLAQNAEKLEEIFL